MESKKIEFFNKLSFITLLSTVFVSLFFFIPYVPVTLGASKGFLLSIGMALSLFFWLIARLGEGTFTFPKDKIILSVALIALVFLISSFFSFSHYVSLFGSGFELGTFGSLLILFVLFFLSAQYFQTEKRIWWFLGSLFLGAFVLALFEIVHVFFGVDRLFPGMLSGISSGNLVGSWNDFALFFGLITLLSLFTLEFIKTRPLFRGMHYVLLGLGILFLIVINVPLVWLMVGIFAVLMFVYNISLQQADITIVGDGKKKFPFLSLSIVFICLVFLVGNNLIGSWVSKYVTIYNPDVRPSISSTLQIAYKSFTHNPALGTGPNTFSIDWSLWQPEQINQTIFWNTDFSTGFGLIPTFIATTGILGLLVWILFFFFYVKNGIRSVKLALTDALSNYFIVGTLMVSLYSWISLIVYSPTIVMVMIAFASSGVLVGLLVYKKATPTMTVSFLSDPRSSFFAILALMVFMMGTLFLTYVYIEKFTSLMYFSRGVNPSNTMESLVKSEKMLSNALTLDKNDLYYRTLSQVYIAQIGALIADKSITQDTLKTSVQQLVTRAEGTAGQAVSQNPKQYLNYMNLGNVYAALVPLAVTNSYESAVSAYTKAHELAPRNPSVYVALAQLEMGNKNNTGARAFARQALDLKQNYTDAIFLLAQIETNEGNLSGAIKQAEYAATMNPNDATVYFRLGLLRYNASEYTNAVSAFERAVILNNEYLNARYYLGLSYQKVGRIADATTQFTILKNVLPESQEVSDALRNVNTVAQPVATPTQTKTATPKKVAAPIKEQ